MVTTPQGQAGLARFLLASSCSIAAIRVQSNLRIPSSVGVDLVASSSCGIILLEYIVECHRHILKRNPYFLS